MRGRVAFAIVCHGRVPNHTAGVAVERNDVRVECRQEQSIPCDRQSAIHLPATYRKFQRKRALVFPQHVAGFRIERIHIVGRHGQVHGAPGHDGSGLEAVIHTALEGPLELEFGGVLCVDLLQTAEAPACVIARIRKPFLRRVGAVRELLRGHWRRLRKIPELRRKHRLLAMLSRLLERAHKRDHLPDGSLVAIHARHAGPGHAIRDGLEHLAIRRPIAPEGRGELRRAVAALPIGAMTGAAVEIVEAVALRNVRG